MAQNLCLGANRSSKRQEILWVLWNPNLNYCNHKSCPYPEQYLFNPFPPFHFVMVHFKMPLLSKPRSVKWPVSLRSPHQNPVCLSPRPIRAACTTHLIILYKVTEIRYIWWAARTISSLCSLLRSLVTLSFLGPNIFLPLHAALHRKSGKSVFLLPLSQNCFVLPSTNGTEPNGTSDCLPYCLLTG
jgi:hypothetical protein